MDLETVLRAADISLPPNSSLVTNSSDPAARVVVAEDEPEVAEEEEDLTPEEGEDTAESEASPASEDGAPTGA